MHLQQPHLCPEVALEDWVQCLQQEPQLLCIVRLSEHVKPADTDAVQRQEERDRNPDNRLHIYINTLSDARYIRINRSTVHLLHTLVHM